ncbi:MAG: 30S ribosomal protein S18 [Parcubacteria group bacterium CG11_big_fil_rev_8_21_14_0_20_39_14]|nr:MAG: 30S ribosomal protein S18 [Parcubacteria group bacterium CG11_big_fil_rev_8_21_14_0_20_39_14]PIS35115.1 MAG: 30S ribosomal protein S18 [Parcubacteria group bacterium CG08_land_8_20_14_0_20_38_56]
MAECYFCKNQIQEINWKDVETIQRFLSTGAKIQPRKKTGLCAKHQRKLSKAIKRARIMGLLPFTTR